MHSCCGQPSSRNCRLRTFSRCPRPGFGRSGLVRVYVPPFIRSLHTHIVGYFLSILLCDVSSEIKRKPQVAILPPSLPLCPILLLSRTRECSPRRCRLISRKPLTTPSYFPRIQTSEAGAAADDKRKHCRAHGASLYPFSQGSYSRCFFQGLLLLFCENYLYVYSIRQRPS